MLALEPLAAATGWLPSADGFSLMNEREPNWLRKARKVSSRTQEPRREEFSHTKPLEGFTWRSAGRETSQDRAGAHRGLQRNGSGEINKSSMRPAGSITRAGTHVACFTHRRMQQQQQPAYATHERGQKVGPANGSDIRKSTCNRLLPRSRIKANRRHNGYVTRSQLFRFSQNERMLRRRGPVEELLVRGVPEVWEPTSVFTENHSSKSKEFSRSSVFFKKSFR